MVNLEFKNLNESPVKCFKWLNVNEKTANIQFVENKTYDKDFCIFGENEQYKLTEYKNYLSTNKTKGLSNEFVEIVKNNYNSGFSLIINKNTKTKDNILINYELDEQNNQLLNIAEIIVEEDATATLVMVYKKEENVSITHLSLLKIKTKKNSNLKIIKINMLENNLESISVEQDEKSNVDFICVDFAKKTNIINYFAELKGIDSKNSFETAYFGQDDDILDFNFKIDHIGKNTKGFMDTRGILKDASKKTMHQTINFVRGSNDAKGSESEYVMIVSPNVLNNSIPLLLCGEDNVSGEHAAGIGRINESTLFYLCARGLSLEEAKRLIITGYLNPIIDKIDIAEIKSEIYREITKRTAEYV